MESFVFCAYPPPRAAIVLAVVVALALPRAARAEPWFDLGQDDAEDRYLDGEFDEEDHVAARAGGRVATSDVHDESWIGLRGYTRALARGKTDVAGMVVVGLALDRLGRGPPPRVAAPRRVSSPPSAVAGGAFAAAAAVEPASSMPPASPIAPASPIPPASPIAPASPIPPGLARDCVAASLRASGLGADDERLDSIVARSRASALLPETRMRAMRLWQDASRATTLASADGTTYYDAIGAHLVLELRLTWRFDRLLYAGDEPTIERVRIERFDARTRIATRTLEALFAWTRATAQAQAAVAGSPEEAEARLRAAEAAATLDVLTSGWFTLRGGARGPA